MENFLEKYSVAPVTQDEALTPSAPRPGEETSTDKVSFEEVSAGEISPASRGKPSGIAHAPPRGAGADTAPRQRAGAHIGWGPQDPKAQEDARRRGPSGPVSPERTAVNIRSETPANRIGAVQGRQHLSWENQLTEKNCHCSKGSSKI